MRREPLNGPFMNPVPAETRDKVPPSGATSTNPTSDGTLPSAPSNERASCSALCDVTKGTRCNRSLFQQGAALGCKQRADLRDGAAGAWSGFEMGPLAFAAVGHTLAARSRQWFCLMRPDWTLVD